MNPEYPRDGRFKGKLIPEMTWGEEAPPDAALLNKPIEMHVDDQGRVYVLDWGDMHIKVYGPDGKFLRTIGRQRAGPGGVHDSGLHGPDVGRPNMPPGRRAASGLFPVERRPVPVGFLLSRDISAAWQSTAKTAFISRNGGRPESQRLSTEFREIPYVTSIIRTDVSGKDMVHLVDFLGENMVMKAMGGGTMGREASSTSLGPWIGEEGSTAAITSSIRLGAYGPDGKLEFAFGREFTPLKNPRFSGQVGQKKMMPAFGRTIVFDDDDNLWLELA